MSPICVRLVTATLSLLLGLGTAWADVVTDWNVTALGVSELAPTQATTAGTGSEMSNDRVRKHNR